MPGAEKRPLLVIGWMEYVDLPEFGLDHLKAKIDTGARTSALHATDIETFRNGDAEWVRFRTVIAKGSRGGRIECPIHDFREIKNTGGIPEDRIVIRTKFRIARRSWTIDLSLTDRSSMTFALIVGRSALKNHSIAVHTRRAYLTQNDPA